MAEGAVGVSDLLASAFTSALGLTVVTYDQYQEEKKEKKDQTYFEPLNIDQLFQVSHLHGKFGDRDTSSVRSLTSALKSTAVTDDLYQKKKKDKKDQANFEPLDIDQVSHSHGKFGDRDTSSAQSFDVSVPPFDIFIIGFEGKVFHVRVTDDTVKSLKEKVQDTVGIHPDELRLVHGGKQLEDCRTLSDHNIRNNSTIHMVMRLPGGGAPIYYIDPSLLDPKFNYNFTKKVDDGKKYYRGGYEYHRPYGWKRYAIKVLGRFENDKWLGEQGLRFHSSEGEWPVSYHGTGKSASGSIAQDGYRLSKGKRFKYGSGIYSTPSIQVAAKYAQVFNHEGKKYKVVFQNRVCPTDLKIVDAQMTGVGEYWLQPRQEYIRPYGICVQQLS